MTQINSRQKVAKTILYRQFIWRQELPVKLALVHLATEYSLADSLVTDSFGIWRQRAVAK